MSAHDLHDSHDGHGMHDHPHHMDTNISTHSVHTTDGSGMSAASPVDHSSHSHHHGHIMESMANHMMHKMVMSFHGGHNETILFDQWTISSTTGLVYSMIVIFIAGALYEGLKYYREHLFWKTYNALQYRAVTVPEKNNIPEDSTRVVYMTGEVIQKQPFNAKPTMFSWMHAYQTLLHIIQVTLSFLLMLIFMTYNTWLCLAVVLGAAAGFFLFGWRKSVKVDVTEHCH